MKGTSKMARVGGGECKLPRDSRTSPGCRHWLRRCSGEANMPFQRFVYFFLSFREVLIPSTDIHLRSGYPGFGSCPQDGGDCVFWGTCASSRAGCVYVCRECCTCESCFDPLFWASILLEVLGDSLGFLVWTTAPLLT